MRKFKSLKILDKFSFLFEKMGVNYKVMRSILEIKLTMDERRVPVALGNTNNKDKDDNLFKKSLISYGIMGLFIMFFIIVPIPIYAGMSISFGMLMFMLLTTMIADFSSVLLDIKSKNILLSRPIDEKTYNMSKIVHIFIYMFTITVVMAGPSLIAGTIKHGILFFLIYFIELILIAGLVVFLTSLLYSLILKYFDGEKLKDIINYFQIILSIIMIVGYQLIGRMFNLIDVKIVANPKWWNFLIPPAWFAAPFEVFINSNYKGWYVYLSLVALIIPILSLLIHSKVVMPSFESNLLKLNSSGEKGSSSAERKQKLHKKIAGFFCFNKTERTFFRFSQNLLSNERKLKLKVYPTLAFAAVFPFLTLLNYVRRGTTFAEILSSLSQGKAYLGLYLSIFMLSSTVMLIELSENYKGAWIYKALPIESPEFIYKGAIKGYIFKYCVGILSFVSLIFLILYKFSIILDVVLMFINMMLIIAIMFKSGRKRLPFSENIDKIEKQNTGSFLLLLLIIGVTAGLHFLTRINTLIFYAYIVAALIATIIMWRKVFKVNWEAFN
ncbi:ABC transporter permease [Proteiniborus sp. MB09-C3]|uniref:ABC transporter permease n=1 Tax=Proteiniborus sp. MB09-C3 TaxID=3050072 RepID=UPI0025552FAA|nr:ABC transporter permease [Proteiniborus sp. MB09-C3]WIV13095.1 ABC transporter permease [Proteiniborus sp. MB09-C3]